MPVVQPPFSIIPEIANLKAQKGQVLGQGIQNAGQSIGQGIGEGIQAKQQQYLEKMKMLDNNNDYVTKEEYDALSPAEKKYARPIAQSNWTAAGLKVPKGHENMYEVSKTAERAQQSVTNINLRDQDADKRLQETLASKDKEFTAKQETQQRQFDTKISVLQKNSDAKLEAQAQHFKEGLALRDKINAAGNDIKAKTLAEKEYVDWEKQPWYETLGKKGPKQPDLTGTTGGSQPAATGNENGQVPTTIGRFQVVAH